MEVLLVLLVLFLIGVLIIFPIWTLISVSNVRRENQQLTARLRSLEINLKDLRHRPEAPPAGRRQPEPHSAPAADITVHAPRTYSPRDADIAPAVTMPPSAPASASAPKPPAPPPIQGNPFKLDPDEESPRAPRPPARRSAPAFAVPAINWEQFMGVKLFAWIGGLALFLGVAFFIKYSFENNLIPPEVRVALGFLTGAGLIAGGVVLARKRYAVTGQTLCGTGVVILYAVTFACRSIYHFEFFGTLPTAALMVLVTTAAFLLAVRLDARVVAILGVLGGFLTPLLLSTGQDNPAGLFGYLALLNTGLIAIALHRRWHFLFPLGAGCTVLMQIGWTEKFFAPEKFITAIIILLGFIALFLAAVLVARRRKDVSPLLLGTTAALPFTAFGFGLYFLNYNALAAQPGLLFAFLLLADAAVFALAWLEKSAVKAHTFAGAIVFTLLALWTGGHLTPALLPWALAIYLAFAALHAVGPLLLARRHPAAQTNTLSQLWPVLTLLLMLVSLNRLPVVSLLFWPAVLLLDALAVALAVVTASLAGLAAVLVLTLIATALWLFKIPADLTHLPALLLVLGGFTAFFFAGGLWVARRLGPRLNPLSSDGLQLPGAIQAQIPSLSVLLPFALLVMVVARLPLLNPSPVFGLALLLVILALGLSRLMKLGWLPAATLAGLLALEYTWQQRLLTGENAPLALGWTLTFYALFAVFPFVFKKTFVNERGPWIVAALSGPLHFALVHRAVAAAWPNNLMGLLPAAFALPALAALISLLRTLPADHPQRLARLAWFGGAALFFITLIFPIQFDRQWITLGWALEGVALLWLFHRVPHPGLRGVGVGLLIAAFARLALNPAVFDYHARGAAPIFNWYLYAYGVTTLALFAGARLLAPPRDRLAGSSAPAILNSLGVVLAFFLLNIEIADYFSTAGSTLTFQFSGNFARDMTYTIAWALFALGLLVVGIAKRQPAARYAALALLSVTLLKLFFHDLANLGSLYRIVALIAVAVIAMLASFIYQRFLPAAARTPDSDEPPVA